MVFFRARWPFAALTKEENRQTLTPQKQNKNKISNRFLVERLNKKHKAANVKPFMVKNHLWVFINAAIENPAFDSQTKETLTTVRERERRKKSGSGSARVPFCILFLL